MTVGAMTPAKRVPEAREAIRARIRCRERMPNRPECRARRTLPGTRRSGGARELSRAVGDDIPLMRHDQASDGLDDWVWIIRVATAMLREYRDRE